ncbi:alpha/beta-hydrolase [Dichomitus squalens]|nr:alpha/beta-hydrolase [Dichomitus squalens]
MVNSLTRNAGLKLGPIILETLVKHYFDRIAKDHESEESTRLRREELLYDEAFIVIKSFMEAATKHTVEELQAFSNMRTPSPPWVHAVRLLVPMTCCDEAATHLIKALGGEEVTKHVVGGTKWWQVRGVKGVDAEWMVAKKDYQEAKKKQKACGTSGPEPPENGDANEEMPSQYQPEMDEMRCVLYAHGGGYYFGSLDQERYSIQRLARKINGRVFAINYRLAPQYPFPCAIQDFIAAYLYLIQPPPGALHTPVSPSSIVFAGDSAGGGLCIAGLQVIRDSGLPMPAGAVLISPWCDLTHSFPSIHLNTATDIIPPYGLSFHKPSTLWPPPPDHVTTRVHQGLRVRVREAVRPKDKGKEDSDEAKPRVPSSDPLTHPGGLPSRPQTPDYTLDDPSTGRKLHLGAAQSLPTAVTPDSVRSQKVEMTTAKGEKLAIDGQVHMYTPNYLLTHPLVSPVVSYLGGLPPLLVSAGDKEVLRDEIIYFAHKAAHPEKYPVKPESKLLYPALEGIEQRYGPTKVHLQVYDDCAHTLPILFAFTTPGKYCFRAMATFIKYVTGMLPKPSTEVPMVLGNENGMTLSPESTQMNLLRSASTNHANQEQASLSGPSHLPIARSEPLVADNIASTTSSPLLANSVGALQSGPSGAPVAPERRKSKRRAFSTSVSRASSFLRRRHATSEVEVPPIPSSPRSPPHGHSSSQSSDVGGPRWQFHRSSADPLQHYAGEVDVYDNGLDTMIRERISTRGVIRPLEPESELSAFRLPSELIGEISELAVRRYMDGTITFGKKFKKATTAIEKARTRNLERARQDTMRNMVQLQAFLQSDKEQEGTDAGEKEKGVVGGQAMQGLVASGSWQWAWALDMDENPPPSSIVSRRDTEEARRLAKIADHAVLTEDHTLSGNNLWQLIVNFLTTTPDRDQHKHHKRYDHKHEREEKQDTTATNPDRPVDVEGTAQAKPGEKAESTSRREKIVSKFAWLAAENRKSQRAAANGHGEQ